MWVCRVVGDDQVGPIAGSVFGARGGSGEVELYAGAVAVAVQFVGWVRGDCGLGGGVPV